MGYQGECLNCGWVGVHGDSHAEAEAEATSHASDCPANKVTRYEKGTGLDALSCASGCVAGSKIKNGKWVLCPSCGEKNDQG